MASVELDRILYHCTVVNINDESYRIKDRKRNSLPTMKKRGRKMKGNIYRVGQFKIGVYKEDDKIHVLPELGKYG